MKMQLLGMVSVFLPKITVLGHDAVWSWTRVPPTWTVHSRKGLQRKALKWS